MVNLKETYASSFFITKSCTCGNKIPMVIVQHSLDVIICGNCGGYIGTVGVDLDGVLLYVEGGGQIFRSSHEKESNPNPSGGVLDCDKVGPKKKEGSN